MEDAGIPTVALANLIESVRRLRLPRAAVVKFPRGANCGAPHAVQQQRAVLLETLRVLEQAAAADQPVELPFAFAGAA